MAVHVLPGELDLKPLDLAPESAQLLLLIAVVVVLAVVLHELREDVLDLRALTFGLLEVALLLREVVRGEDLGCDSLELDFLACDLALLLRGVLVDLPGDCGIELGSRYPLEDLGPGVGVGMQEVGELSLREDHDAVELLPVEAYDAPDERIALARLLGDVAVLPAALVVFLDPALRVLEPAVSPLAGALHLPAGDVALPLHPDELDLGVARGGSPREYVPRIGVGEVPEAVLLRAAVPVGQGLGLSPFPHREPHGLPVERERNRVKDGAFSGARRAGYRVEPRAPEDALVELDDKNLIILALEARKVPDLDSQNLHDLPPSSSPSCSLAFSTEAW